MSATDHWQQTLTEPEQPERLQPGNNALIFGLIKECGELSLVSQNIQMGVTRPESVEMISHQNVLQRQEGPSAMVSLTGVVAHTLHDPRCRQAEGWTFK